MSLWATWWAWMAAALVLAILEMLAPFFVLLGFAFGAALTGALVWFGVIGPEGAIHSLPLTLVMFALLSLASWFLLQRLFPKSRGHVKIWEKDINED